mmetsp:Transcript_64196/g.200997  ORF Transcript_64196/g.200997 Transcript_64196/m.200997 type:complete len:328 (-) Transcript_64196:4-987(-)
MAAVPQPCHPEPGPDMVPVVDLDGPAAPALVAEALQRSGFLLAHSSALPAALLQRALLACKELLSERAAGVEQHPSDPKRYRMLRRADLESESSPVPDAGGGGGTLAGAAGDEARAVLLDYWEALAKVKELILRALARGLDLEDDFFACRHREGNDALRLLHYPPAPGAGNRCKEHSDYGTITLLGTDGTAGLEIWDDASGLWAPVPDGGAASGVAANGRGALVVNAGSLLSAWTNDAVRATLHRVAGPASVKSGSPPERLLEAASTHRYSMALFVDPDPGLALRELAGDIPASVEASGSVADYVRWRCGVAGEGVNYAPGEEGRTG